MMRANKGIQNGVQAGLKSTQARQIPFAGLLHLSVVYFVYGSTYLAIRVAVQEGGGFSPFILGLSRLILAGLVLLLWAVLARERIRITRDEALVLGLSGLLFWTGANNMVMLAEQRASSGLAALIAAATPIWTALIDSGLDRRLPSMRLTLALLVGFAGIGLLSAPSLGTGTQGDATSIALLVGASISWACASVLQSRRPLKLAPQVNSGYQHLFGSVGFLVFTLIAREPKPTPSPQAWLAWGYLVLFGSVLAFTSYMQVLRLLPINLVTTYAYVNPVIAVLLGALILKEPITLWTVGGAFLVLIGVVGVFRDRKIRQLSMMPGSD